MPDLVVSGDLERKDLNTGQHALVVDKKLLAMPDIVKIVASLGVLHASRVSAGDEVGDTAVDTG